MGKIIFDLDSTLLFLAPEWERYYQMFIDKYHLNITPIELYSTIACIEKEFTNIVITRQFLIDYLNNRLNINMDEEKLDSFMEFYLSIPLLKTEEVLDVIKDLYTKHELIAFSNWFSSSQSDRLRKAGILKYFSKVYGWDDLPLKPSREAIETIVGNEKIHDYTFVGDNIETDLSIPKIMGMKTIFYNRKRIEQDSYKEVQEISELKRTL